MAFLVVIEKQILLGVEEEKLIVIPIAILSLVIAGPFGWCCLIYGIMEFIRLCND